MAKSTSQPPSFKRVEGQALGLKTDEGLHVRTYVFFIQIFFAFRPPGRGQVRKDYEILRRVRPYVMRRERKAKARKEAHSGECTAVNVPFTIHTYVELSSKWSLLVSLFS